MSPTKGAEVSDLTEFLLARIAEDYADAMSGWRWKALPVGEYERLQARVLRECEAKRELVDDFTVLDADYKASRLDSTESRRFQALVAMSRAASVYADHADYREEWKP